MYTNAGIHNINTYEIRRYLKSIARIPASCRSNSSTQLYNTNTLSHNNTGVNNHVITIINSFCHICSKHIKSYTHCISYYQPKLQGSIVYKVLWRDLPSLCDIDLVLPRYNMRHHRPDFPPVCYAILPSTTKTSISVRRTMCSTSSCSSIGTLYI